MNTSANSPTLAQIERAKLNGETALMAWTELARFFAQGAVMSVHPSLDLIDVAARMSLDDIASIRLWHETGALGFVSDAQATRWAGENLELWTVVVKPYILVQEPKTAPSAQQTH